MDRNRLNPSAPDIVNICVDGRKNGEGWGHFYHCYSEEAVPFEDEYQLLRSIEEFFESINFPQAAVQIRTFGGESKRKEEKVVKVLENEKVVKQTGKMGTFIVHVQYRQNATWQGEVLWADKKEAQKFRSALELLKLIDSALDIAEKEKGEKEDER